MHCFLGGTFPYYRFCSIDEGVCVKPYCAQHFLNAFNLKQCDISRFVFLIRKLPITNCEWQRKNGGRKEDKVKQEIMNFKSMRYAKHDRIKGYETGMLEPIGKDIQESSAISRMTGKPEVGRIFKPWRTESPVRSMQINELRRLIKSRTWGKITRT